MTQSEFDDLLSRVDHLSPEQLQQLRDELNHKLAAAPAESSPALTPEEEAEQDLQRRLVAAGLLSEVKPPPRLLPPRPAFMPVPIQGEPLSETVIRERR